MKDKRRELLICYLLGTLEPDESAKIEEELQTDVVLRDDLASLAQEISTINEITDSHEPPIGLATQTCQNIWTKTDSTHHSHNSHIDNRFAVRHESRKKRRITVAVSQPSDGFLEEPVIRQTPPVVSDLPGDLPEEQISEELNTDAVVPLSQALRFSASGKLRKPNELIRRVDQPEKVPQEAHLNLDSMEIVRSHPPKHYGRENKTEKVKAPYSTRDVMISLMIGLLAAVLAFPLIQWGINSFSEMVIQRQIENFAKSVPPNTSQYSLSGISQSDVRMITSIDPQSATTFQNQRNNTEVRYNVSE